MPNEAVLRELRFAANHCGVSVIGFGVDVAVLHIMLWVGLEPAWARVVSLACAMHVTFVINGLRVFRQLDRRLLVGQWARYMVCNGIGNICNYWIFVTMISSHWPVIANPTVAVAVGSAGAWAINFCATRFVVFPQCHQQEAQPCPRNDPSPTSP